MRISDWSSDVCSSDLPVALLQMLMYPCRADAARHDADIEFDGVGRMGIAGKGEGAGQNPLLPHRQVHILPRLEADRPVQRDMDAPDRRGQRIDAGDDALEILDRDSQRVGVFLYIRLYAGVAFKARAEI